MTIKKSTILFWLEMLTAIVFIAISYLFYLKNWVKPDTVLIIDVLVGLNAINAVMMKLFIDTRADVLAKHYRYIDGCVSEIGDILSKVADNDDLKYARTALDSMLCRLRRIQLGVHELNPSDYYHHVIATIGNAPPGSNVYAVNSLPIERWVDDPREVHYMNANFEAVVRKVKVHRIFILDKPATPNEFPQAARDIITEHRVKGILVDVVWRNTIRELELLDDFVIFEHNPTIFLDWHDPGDPLRILRGERIKSKDTFDDYLRRFDKLDKTLTVDRVSVDRALGITEAH
jgi:hypothetical protein